MIARLACPFKSDRNTNPRRYIRGVCTKELVRYRVLSSCGGHLDTAFPRKRLNSNIEHLSRDVSLLKRTRSIQNVYNRVATFHILIFTLQNNVFLFTVYKSRYIMIYLISMPISSGEIK